MIPLFEVGEEVILWPTSGPGRGMCVEVIRAEYINDNRVRSYCYDIHPDPASHILIENDWPRWRESALRKKPKGTGKTLTEFMDELKYVSVTV